MNFWICLWIFRLTGFSCPFLGAHFFTLLDFSFAWSYVNVAVCLPLKDARDLADCVNIHWIRVSSSSRPSWLGITDLEAKFVLNTRSVCAKKRCRDSVDGTCCTSRSRLISKLSSQRGYFLPRLCGNLLNRRRHSRVVEVFLVLLLRQKNCNPPQASFS